MVGWCAGALMWWCGGVVESVVVAAAAVVVVVVAVVVVVVAGTINASLRASVLLSFPVVTTFRLG